MSSGKTITMSSLGKNGRFGNQFFQYAFLKCLSKEKQYSLELPDWGGREIFTLNDPYILVKLPRVYHLSNDKNYSLITQLDGRLYNCDLWGWFQFHTSYYQPYKSYISQLFSQNKFYKAECSLILNQLFEKGKTIVSIHLRRGDADAKGPYFYAPTLWYIEWLESIWATLERPVLFIASEDPGSVVADFQNYNPYTLSDFYTGSDKHSYYFDFYILQNSNYLAISNSTFSFAASMLNHKCNIFYRPCRHSGRLVLFNPWNSDPLLDNIYEPYVKLAARVKELFQTINKNSVSALNQIRNVRKQMINIWLSTSEYELEPLFHSKFGTAYRAFLNSPLKTKQMDLQEHHLKQELMDNVNLGMEKAWFMQYLLSAMLLCEPVDFSFNNDLLLFPDWFLSDYINYLKLPLAIR